MSRILEGVRVLDFGSFIAGPYCAALLGDFGADVIRVERPGGANDRFLMPLSSDENGDGALFLQVNRNKRSFVVDMACGEGRRITRDLIATADVVIANLPRRVLVAMGLDYTTLTAIRPDVILCTCTAFGGSDAARNRPGFDGVGQALSGAMHMTGEKGRPRKAHVHYVDFCTASLSALGVALALMERRQSGRGQVVELSLLHTALALMSATLLEEAALGVGREGTGNRSQIAGPSDCFRTSDGWILIQVVSDAMFAKWAKLIGQPELGVDPRFSSDARRGRNGLILSERMAAWCRDRTTSECLATLGNNGIPAAAILSPVEALSHPDVNAEEYFGATRQSGERGEHLIARTPVRLSRSAGMICRPAPRLGEHTAEVMKELGRSQSDIERLCRTGVIETGHATLQGP